MTTQTPRRRMRRPLTPEEQVQREAEQLAKYEAAEIRRRAQAEDAARIDALAGQLAEQARTAVRKKRPLKPTSIGRRLRNHLDPRVVAAAQDLHDPRLGQVVLDGAIERLLTDEYGDNVVDGVVHNALNEIEDATYFNRARAIRAVEEGSGLHPDDEALRVEEWATALVTRLLADPLPAYASDWSADGLVAALSERDIPAYAVDAARVAVARWAP